MKEERYAGFVQQKYDSLKMDLTSNKISIISMEMFVEEYRKAQSHFNSFYRKLLQPNEWLVTDQKKELTINHLLSVMIYCNFDQIQYHFSKTYRENIQNHNNFYHLASNLKSCVHRFGIRILKGNIKKFYHGIGQKLSFPSYINQKHGGIIIKSPLSTTSSFCVAVNFTNHNNGLVIEFRDSKSELSPKYFSTAWLSDYPNEKEHLFIQNNKFELLSIHNIVDATNGYQYGSYLDALQNVEYITTSNYSWHSDINQYVSVKIIKYQLSKKHDAAITAYGSGLIDTYFQNKKDIKLQCMQLMKHESLAALFLYINRKIEYYRIGDQIYCDKSISANLVQIVKLFPNTKEILINEMQRFDCVSLDQLIEYYDTSYLKTSSKHEVMHIQLQINILYFFDHEKITKYKDILKNYGIELDIQCEEHISCETALLKAKKEFEENKNIQWRVWLSQFTAELQNQIDQQCNRIKLQQQKIRKIKRDAVTFMNIYHDYTVNKCVEYIHNIFDSVTTTNIEYTAFKKYVKTEHINNVTLQKALKILSLQCIDLNNLLIDGYIRRIEIYLPIDVQYNIKELITQYFSLSLWKRAALETVNLLALKCFDSSKVNSKDMGLILDLEEKQSLTNEIAKLRSEIKKK
eukprot:62159_1